MGSHRTNLRSPLIATVAITSRCPLNCFHCSEGNKNKLDLPAEAIGQTIDGLVELGCPVIALTGGEPFARADFTDFLDRIPPSIAVIIYSSGFGLTERIAETLRRRPNLALSLSLDHFEEAEHDRRRGRQGAFQAALKAISLIRDSRVELHVSTVLTSDRNQEELEALARMLKRSGVTCLQFFQARPVGLIANDRGPLLSPDQEAAFIELARGLNAGVDYPLVISYPEIERPDLMGCCGGYGRVYIDSQGNVCPCDFAPLSFGSILEEPFGRIWERMRGFFRAPGSRCLVRDNPEVFEPPRDQRNVIFERLDRPERLLSPVPGIFARFGEKRYRALLPNLPLISVTAPEWRHG